MVKLYARDVPFKARVHDLDTERDIRGVIWVDEEEGLAEAYRFNPDGSRRDDMVLLKGRFKILPALEQKEPDYGKLLGADRCEICASPLVMQGGDLCPICRAAQDGNPFKPTRLDPWDFRKCQRCSRNATWSVVDRVDVSPEAGKIAGYQAARGGAYLFARGAAVGRRYYCSWCFQAPRLVDVRGEVIREIEETIRPDA